MDDCVPETLDRLDELDGSTPQVFRHVFVPGEEPVAWRDAAALARELSPSAEATGSAEGADLIAIGSAAGARAGTTALDSAGRDLVEGASCPVAIAPGGFAERDDREIRRIEVGVDGSREAAAALRMAGRLAGVHDARLRIVAVAESPSAPEQEDLPADPRELDRLARHLAYAGVAVPGLWVEPELREGTPDQVLVDLALDAGLMVLGSRAGYADEGRVRLGKVSERVLAASPCPVLLVPAP